MRTRTAFLSKADATETSVARLPRLLLELGALGLALALLVVVAPASSAVSRRTGNERRELVRSQSASHD